MARAVKSRSDGFVTFLEGLERRNSAEQAAGHNPMILLKALAASGPQPVPVLLATGGMNIPGAMETLKTLCDLGLVRLAGPEGQEQVELTPNGEEMLRLGATPG